jgi:hypothetical protein
MLLESGQAYNELRGLMMRGHAEIVEDREVTADVLRRIAAKMSGLESVSPAQNEALLAQAAKRVVIRFHPEKFASWDHSKM